MNIRTEGMVVVLSGNFDGRSTDRVRHALRQCLASPEHEIVVDLSLVEVVDVPALRVLAFASHEAPRTGHHVTLRGAGPAVRRMLHLTRLIRFVELESAA